MITLQFSQQFGRIGLDINDASYILNKQEPDVQISQAKPDLQVQTVASDLEIDYRPRQESMGVGGIWFTMRSQSADCEAAFEQNLVTSVQTGRLIGKIENKVAIGDAVFDALTPPEHEVTIAALAPIEISYTPAEIHTSVEADDIDYSVDLGKISVEDFVFPSVHAFLEQTPYLEIKAVGQAIDIKQ